jgi:hypothetical protein
VDKLKDYFAKLAQKKRRDTVEVYVALRQTGALATIVDDIIDNFSSVYNGSVTNLDPQRLAYEAGARAVIQYILTQVEVTPAELLHLRKQEQNQNG